MKKFAKSIALTGSVILTVQLSGMVNDHDGPVEPPDHAELFRAMIHADEAGGDAERTARIQRQFDFAQKFLGPGSFGWGGSMLPNRVAPLLLSLLHRIR